MVDDALRSVLWIAPAYRIDDGGVLVIGLFHAAGHGQREIAQAFEVQPRLRYLFPHTGYTGETGHHLMHGAIDLMERLPVIGIHQALLFGEIALQCFDGFRGRAVRETTRDLHLGGAAQEHAVQQVDDGKTGDERTDLRDHGDKADRSQPRQRLADRHA